MSQTKAQLVEGLNINTSAPADALVINSSGNVGIGTTSPVIPIQLNNYGGLDGNANQLIISNNTYYSSGDKATKTGFSTRIDLTNQDGSIRFINTAASSSANAAITLQERLRIDSSGRVGVGTSAPYNVLTGKSLSIGNGVGAAEVNFLSATDGYGSIYFGDGTSGNATYRGYLEYVHADDSMRFGVAASERMRIDSSGNVGIGTSSFTATSSGRQILEINGTSSSLINLDVGGTRKAYHFTDGTSVYSYNTANGNYIFGTNDSERMRIDSSGHILFGTTTNGSTAVGTVIRSTGETLMTRNDGNSLLINRMSTDGILIDFRQNNTSEGSINVSGSSVTLVGAHLSRWSQLPGGVERIEILRGSVLSNLDEMCEWGEEDNEQLNRMKVSDVEGDKNVSGVFQSWDDDDNTYVNDFHCAMTGDFVIRIAQGTTVARGDLLMSAGDGTAKPQEDDIVRSKTIAKVTSTTVSTTYSDNSYCVPCVLMAC